MPQWTLEHRVFAYDSFLKSGESIIENQRLFRCRFNIGRHGNIASRNTILRWVTSFRARGTIMKKKPPGPGFSTKSLFGKSLLTSLPGLPDTGNGGSMIFQNVAIYLPTDMA